MFFRFRLSFYSFYFLFVTTKFQRGSENKMYFVIKNILHKKVRHHQKTYVFDVRLEYQSTKGIKKK